MDGLLEILKQVISIHALREEGDAKLPQRLSLLPEFLSTPSARRATQSGLLIKFDR